MWDFVMDKSGAGAGLLRELRFPLPMIVMMLVIVIFELIVVIMSVMLLPLADISNDYKDVINGCNDVINIRDVPRTNRDMDKVLTILVDDFH
jgi:hypothetical protein